MYSLPKKPLGGVLETWRRMKRTYELGILSLCNLGLGLEQASYPCPLKQFYISNKRQGDDHIADSWRLSHFGLQSVEK